MMNNNHDYLTFLSNGENTHDNKIFSHNSEIIS